MLARQWVLRCLLVSVPVPSVLALTVQRSALVSALARVPELATSREQEMASVRRLWLPSLVGVTVWESHQCVRPAFGEQTKPKLEPIRDWRGKP